MYVWAWLRRFASIAHCVPVTNADKKEVFCLLWSLRFRGTQLAKKTILGQTTQAADARRPHDHMPEINHNPQMLHFSFRLAFGPYLFRQPISRKACPILLILLLLLILLFLLLLLLLLLCRLAPLKHYLPLLNSLCSSRRLAGNTLVAAPRTQLPPP